MAKLDRKDVQIFAENSKETLITEFRTEDSEGSTASFSRDPDVIQNENYSQGWVNNTNNLNTKIYGEDLNAVNYVLSYLLKYLYENGIAEWKGTTTYYQNSICKVNDALYLSLQNDNIGNDPTSTVGYWRLIPLENVSIEDAGSGFSIVKDVTNNVITFKTISVTGYGEITDNGDQLNIDIAGGGGGGGGDTYWGMIRGTITNQTDLMALINMKQDIFTVDSPLVLTDDQHLTINKATSSVSGYLDYQDFNTFNNKQDAISATLPISITNNNIAIETAGTSTTGVLSYTDWNNFNNKQDGIQGVQFYYDNSMIKQEPDTNRTSYLGSPPHPYNYAYMDQIGDANNVVTTGYLDDTISRIIHTDDIEAKTVTTPIPNTENRNVTINKINVKWIKSDLFGDNSQTTHAVDISCSEPEGTLATATLGEYRRFNNIKSERLTVNEVFSGNTDSTVKIQNIRFETIRAYTPGSSIELNAGIRPGTDNQVILGANDRKFQAMYSYAYNGASDIRYKENVEDYDEHVLDKLSNIQTITYNYTNDKDKVRRLGISAQALQEQEPLCVNGDEYLNVDLMQYTTLLLKAIQELNGKVKTLEARIDELEKGK